MQISEDLIRKIVDTVMEQLGEAEKPQKASVSSSEVPSMAGRDRINEDRKSVV